jgi:ABC-type transport system involved in cytochrome bd biosynthesis fused ATPase/permease subunit
VRLQQPLTIAYRWGELAVREWLDAIARGYSQSSNVLAGRDSARRIRNVASINFEHVTKRYADGLKAVKDMSLAVAGGDLVILVGPSGSRRSTALGMVAGLEDVTDVVLKIGDELVNGRSRSTDDHDSLAALR